MTRKQSDYSRNDDDLVPEDDSVYAGPLPPEAPPPDWDPLPVVNEFNRGRPCLPPHVDSSSPIDIFRLF